MIREEIKWVPKIKEARVNTSTDINDVLIAKISNKSLKGVI